MAKNTKKAGNGKAARRAKDVLSLIKKGDYRRAQRLAEKRKVEICTAISEEKPPGWALLRESHLVQYARVAR